MVLCSSIGDGGTHTIVNTVKRGTPESACLFSYIKMRERRGGLAGPEPLLHRAAFAGGKHPGAGGDATRGRGPQGGPGAGGGWFL